MVIRRSAVKRLARYAVGLAGIAGWFGFNAVMAFYTYLWRNSPERPDFAAGRVARMYQHRRIFFVEPWERMVAFYGLALTLALVILAAVLGLAFYGHELKSGPKLAWLNASALVAFLALIAYGAWPLAS
jgi:hypothetical protein